MNTETMLFAHGSPSMPMIVDSFEHAKQRALADAVRTGRPQPVLAVDIHHPERDSVEILGYADPDGSYRQAEIATGPGQRFH